ncbi:MAG: DUF1343 domain-containing protein [Pirellulales bacterium]|nr:DUF1343 domain-containing protein [Pirellulales bacterium]
MNRAGGVSIPMRHGLTIGELARLFNEELRLQVELQVVPLDDWSPGQCFGHWRRNWVPPSPNLPRWESTLVYPGQVLLEGTNLSEGRGTTLPFELVGAPYLDAIELSREANQLSLEGVRFLPQKFKPTFDKWAGELCEGVSIHVTDPNVFRSYQMTVALLKLIAQRWPTDFQWLGPPYEYETEKPPIDIISGGDQLRTNCLVEAVEQLCHLDAQQWYRRVNPYLLYPRAPMSS